MALFPQLISLILLFHSAIRCGIIYKRELARSPIVWGEVHSFGVDKSSNQYIYDDENKLRVPLQDLRTLGTKEKPTLQTYGFTSFSGRHVKGIENVKEFSVVHRDLLTKDSVALVKELTRSKVAFPYGAYFRNFNTFVPPFPIIHSDLSARGAKFGRETIQQELLSSGDPRKVKFGNYLKRGDKIVVVNVWRPIHVVQDNPLGLCKWDSLIPEDALDWGIIPTQTENMIQAWDYREGQEWFYTSHQRPDEGYVFMQHDGRAEDGHGINVPHASFSLKGDAARFPKRTSFECRVIAIVESGGTSKTNKNRVKSFCNHFDYTVMTLASLSNKYLGCIAPWFKHEK
ncbi:hypothetical protein DFH28DRAFT_941796 [Melampsora americana]|nr:hypothetical protein DFH28DRAFT_941796 [Melampsora americana]